jgi:hypothetical protein
VEHKFLLPRARISTYMISPIEANPVQLTMKEGGSWWKTLLNGCRTGCAQRNGCSYSHQHAMLIGFALLGTPVTWPQIGGSVIIIFGVIVATELLPKRGAQFFAKPSKEEKISS